MVVTIKLLLSGLLMLASAILAFMRRLPWNYLLCAGIGFSWVGDALLAYYPPMIGRLRDTFVAGMASFALAQMSYIAAFRRSMIELPAMHARIPGEVVGADILPGLLIVYLLVCVFFFVVVMLRSEQPIYLRVGGLLYGLIICTMAAHSMAAAFTGTKIVWPLLFGPLLFILSDGAIAMRIFQQRLEDEAAYQWLVWGTYLPAQILLLLGTYWLY